MFRRRTYKIKIYLKIIKENIPREQPFAYYGVIEFSLWEFIGVGGADAYAFHNWTFGLGSDIVRIHPAGFRGHSDLERQISIESK